MQKTADRMVNSHLERSESFMAVAVYLSVGEAGKALSLLQAIGESDLAYALAELYDDDSNEYLVSIAHSLCDAELLEDALEMGMFTTCALIYKISRNFNVVIIVLVNLHEFYLFIYSLKS